MNQSPTVLITGSSTGIGYDAARFLIEKGYTVLGSVRKEADGQRVRGDLGKQYIPLVFDVTDQAAVQAVADQAAAQLNGRPLSGIINNAGVAVAGPLEYMPLDDLRWQFEVNVFGVVAVTQAFLPLMQPGGRIVNISSVSGKIAYPFFGAYAGSKHALEAISHSMRRELLERGIDVIIIGPGSVKTPIWEKSADSGIMEKYGHTIYAKALLQLGRTTQNMDKNGMPVEKISRTIYAALSDPSPKTRYAIPNSWMRGWWGPRLLPTRLIDRLTAKALQIGQSSTEA